MSDWLDGARVDADLARTVHSKYMWQDVTVECTVDRVLYIAQSEAPLALGLTLVEMQFALMQEESTAFAMPCHARHARLRANRAGPSGLSQLEGRAEPKTLD